MQSTAAARCLLHPASESTMPIFCGCLVLGLWGERGVRRSVERFFARRRRRRRRRSAPRRAARYCRRPLQERSQSLDRRCCVLSRGVRCRGACARARDKGERGTPSFRLSQKRTAMHSISERISSAHCCRLFVSRLATLDRSGSLRPILLALSRGSMKGAPGTCCCLVEREVGSLRLRSGSIEEVLVWLVSISSECARS